MEFHPKKLKIYYIYKWAGTRRESARVSYFDVNSVVVKERKKDDMKMSIGNMQHRERAIQELTVILAKL